MSDPSRRDLANALRAAGAAHHVFETEVLGGERDEQWAGWYAAYVLGRLGDFVSPAVLTAWVSEAPTGDDWAATTAEFVEGRLGGRG